MMIRTTFQKAKKNKEPKKMKAGKEGRPGSRAYDTPLPEGFDDEDDEELVEENAEQRDHEGQARSSKDDKETDDR